MPRVSLPVRKSKTFNGVYSAFTLTWKLLLRPTKESEDNEVNVKTNFSVGHPLE